MNVLIMRLAVVSGLSSSQREGIAQDMAYSFFCTEFLAYVFVFVYFKKKGCFSPYVYLVTLLQFAVLLLGQELSETKKRLNIIFRPFEFIKGHPYSFLRNSLEESVLVLILVTILGFKFARNPLVRGIKFLVSFTFLLTAQNFTFYSAYNFKGVALTYSTSNSVDLFGVFLSVLYVLLSLVYFGFLCAGYKKDSALLALYSEDFPMSKVYYLCFLSSLILYAVTSVLLEDYDPYRMGFVILLEGFLASVLFVLRKKSRKKCVLGIVYHLVKAASAVLVIFMNTGVLSQENGFWVFFSLLYLGVCVCLCKVFVEDNADPGTGYVIDSTIEVSPSHNIRDEKNEPEPFTNSNAYNEYPEGRMQNITFNFEYPVSGGTVQLSEKTLTPKLRPNLNLFTVKRNLSHYK